MDKIKRIAAIIVCVFVIVNIGITMSLKEQIKNLQNEIGSMHSNFSNEIRNANWSINNLKSELVSKIEKGESLLSSIETEAKYKNEQLLFTVNVVPKEKRIDETIFLYLGDVKKEAISTNGLDYTTTFVLTMPQKIIPIVSFESTTGVRQEVLPETYIDELLSLDYESSWENQNSSNEKDDDMLKLSIYVRDEKSYSLLSGTPTAVIAIKDTSTDTEIGRKKMQFVEANTTSNKELGVIFFNSDLSEYLKKEGSYAVWVELKTEGGIFYHEEIASFSNIKKQSFTKGSGTGTLYPIW